MSLIKGLGGLGLVPGFIGHSQSAVHYTHNGSSESDVPSPVLWYWLPTEDVRFLSY
jgi:hypothetical protein